MQQISSFRTESINQENSSGLINIEVKIHPSEQKRVIVINYPGYAGDIDGYNQKYTKLASLIANRVGTTLRISGAEFIRGEDYEQSVVNKLDATIQYALQNSEQLIGLSAEQTEIYLVGFSSGASGIAAICSKYPQIRKILLIAPSGDAGEDACRNGLNAFDGEFYGVIGENDEVVGKDSLDLFASMAKSANKVRTIILPNCDHQFRGKDNGILMSATPIWAFIQNGEGNINPEDGTELY